MNLLAFVLLATNPVELTVRERCDMAEVNHFYDEQGRLVFDQIIFYDWCNRDERHHVRAWRMVKHPGQLPQFDWQRGEWASQWQDGEVLRRIASGSMRETWTQYDPELIEREWLPRERRRELFNPNIERVSAGE